MKIDTLPLVVGLPGPELDREVRAILEEVRPAGVILFSRSVESAPQVRSLVLSLQELEHSPFVAVDLEGGAVNRLAALWGTLPCPARAAVAGRRAVRALGEAAGAACRNLGIHLDLAPVVDLECPDGLIARQSRTLGDNPERVATLARVFLEGMSSWCVGGCLKHFPGLGAVTVDTHEKLPTLTLDEEQLRPHLEAFAALSEETALVMMAHVVVPRLGDGKRPASLSPTLVERAAKLPGSPVVLSDDLEMGALAEWGDLPDRAVAAVKARNHGVIFGKSFSRLPDIADRLREEAERDSGLRSRLQDVSARLGTLRRDLCRVSASVPAPDDTTVAQLWEQARRESEP
jgi:beta-N-acetylhexosaminidase